MYKFLGFLAGSAVIAIPVLLLLEAPVFGWPPTLEENQAPIHRDRPSPLAASQPRNPPAPDSAGEITERAAPLPMDLAPTPPLAGAELQNRSTEPRVANNTQPQPLPRQKTDAPQPPMPESTGVNLVPAGALSTADVVLPEPMATHPPSNPPVGQPAPSPIAEPEHPIAEQPADAVLRTHLLWSPFRTRSAATGFARRLSKVSGVAVRVAESEPGHYRVGFDYPDELQKNWLLGQIQARTGLDLGAVDITETGMDDDAGNSDSAVSAAGLPNG